MLEPRLEVGGILLRPWERGDRESLVEHGDDPQVTRYLADRFPSPYTLDEADRWLDYCADLDDAIASLAIVVDGAACGGIGMERRSDLERQTAEVGYWLGRRYWGRGIAARALVALTEFAFAERDIERLEAIVIEAHRPSARVLEKAGYTLEGRRRRALLKAGTFHDALTYAKLRGEAGEGL